MSTYGIKIGMKFKSYIEFSNFVGYEYTGSRVVLKNRLYHHCEFHKDNNEIIIDKIKDTPSMYIGKNMDFVYAINDIAEISTGKVKILNRFKSNNRRRFYNCECLNDGYIYDISQYSLINRTGCQVCLNKVVLKGVNDIATTRPEIAKLFKNKEESFLYTQFSGKEVEFQCQFCGNVKKLKITTVSRRGHIQCNQCCDHFSYPNKFVYSALKQICPDVKCEVVFKWSDKKRYDLYSEKYNLIIENQGGFHYENNSKNMKMYNTSFSQIHNNDIYKKNLALNNGIVNYVVLDCKKSESEYIKNQSYHQHYQTYANSIKTI